MVFSRLNKEIETSLDTLDALYFFVQSIPENCERLGWLRQNFGKASRELRLNLRDELRREINRLREETRAIASNSFFVSTYNNARKGASQGHVFIPKWDIEQRWFGNFGRVIVRWPYVKDHAMVIYDPQDGNVRNQVFELEGAMFRDAEFLVGEARKFHKGIKNFRERDHSDQWFLHIYLRTGATAIFHYLEAYLNGLAFDCLLHHHDTLSADDHDLLLEWDRNKRRRAFVNVEKKLFRYPTIFAKCLNTTIDLSGCKPAHFLAKDAKELRDALTHPSPHIDRQDLTLRKVTLITTVNLDLVQAILNAAREYTVTVEQNLFGHPHETVPWLFRPGPEP